MIIKVSNKNAFTVVELMVAVAIISLLLLFFVPVVSYVRRVDSTMERLDSYHDIRRVDQIIASKLKFGTEIIYPPRRASYFASSPGPWYPQTVFRNSLNQTVVLFVDNNDRLMMLNYDNVSGGQIAPGRVLANRIKGFSVRRYGNSVLEYRLAFDADNREFSVTNKISMLNVF